MDLDITLQDRTMKTPVYIKMDASEPLLLSEGVCRQLGIISYHPEVFPVGKKALNSELEFEGADKCQVPTVRVQLVQSLRLLPNQSVMAEGRLIGEGLEDPKGPLLLEPDSELKERWGLQIADTVFQHSREGTIKVLLTNCLGFSQRAEEGMEIGSVVPVEVVDPQKPAAMLLIGGGAELATGDPDEVLSNIHYSHPGVKAIRSDKQENEDMLSRQTWKKQSLQRYSMPSLLIPPLRSRGNTYFVPYLRETMKCLAWKMGREEKQT